MAARIAVIVAALELVYHHPLEDVGLVVDIVENVSPEGVEDLLGNQESADAHPQTVRKGDYGKGDDEIREDGCHEDNEGFGGDEVEEDPHDEGEEGGRGRLEVGEPVGDDRKERGDYDCWSVRFE